MCKLVAGWHRNSCTSVHTLALRDCALGDAGASDLADALAQISPAPLAYRSIDLRENHIYERGVAALAARCGAFEALVIDITDNPGAHSPEASVRLFQVRVLCHVAFFLFVLTIFLELFMCSIFDSSVTDDCAARREKSP